MEVQKHGFVYIWFDWKRKMFYIGCHWGQTKDKSGKNHSMYGKKHTEESKRKMSESLKGKEPWNMGR